MSSIIRFFIAPDDAAAAGVPRSGTARGPETVELGNFDPQEMLDDWETAFLARDAGEIAEGGRPVVGGGARDVPAEGSGVLIAMSPDLATDLAEADEARLTEEGVDDNCAACLTPVPVRGTASGCPGALLESVRVPA